MSRPSACLALAVPILVALAAVGRAEPELTVPEIRERIVAPSTEPDVRVSLVVLLFHRGRDGETALRELLAARGPAARDARREVAIRAHVALLPDVFATEPDDPTLRALFYQYRTRTLATALAGLVRDTTHTEPARRRFATAIGWLRSRAAGDVLIELWREGMPGARTAFDGIVPLGFENAEAAAAWWEARADQPLERVLADALRGSGEEERRRLDRVAAEHREWAQEALPRLPVTFVIERGLGSIDAVVRGVAADLLGKRDGLTDPERTLAANGLARSIRDFPRGAGDDLDVTRALVSVLVAATGFADKLSAREDRDVIVGWVVEHVSPERPPALRDAAIKLIGALGGAKGVPALQRAFADGAPELKIRTLEALRGLKDAGLGAWAMSALERELDARRPETDGVVEQLVRLLGTTGDIGALPILERVLRESEDFQSRRAAVTAISQVGRLEVEGRPLSDAAIDALLNLALVDIAPQVREQAARSELPFAPSTPRVRDAMLAQLRAEKAPYVSQALAVTLRSVFTDVVLPDIARAAGQVPQVEKPLDEGVEALIASGRFELVVATAGELLRVAGNAPLAARYVRRVVEAEGAPASARFAALELAVPVAESLAAAETVGPAALGDALVLARAGAREGEKEPFLARRHAVLLRLLAQLGRYDEAEIVRAGHPADSGDTIENVTQYRLEEARLFALTDRLDRARATLGAIVPDGLPPELGAKIKSTGAELDGLAAVRSQRLAAHLEVVLTRPRDEHYRLLLPGVRQGGAPVKARFLERVNAADPSAEPTADLVARLRDVFPKQAKDVEWATADTIARRDVLKRWKDFLTAR